MKNTESTNEATSVKFENGTRVLYTGTVRFCDPTDFYKFFKRYDHVIDQNKVLTVSKA